MEIKQININNFENEVTNQKSVVLLDFWAPWCGPCRMLAPILEDLAVSFDNKIVIGKVNVDENREIALKYQISAIPTILLFKDGALIKQIVGLRSVEDLSDEINSIL